MTYAELAATTHFSFLRGASHPADMVVRALDHINGIYLHITKLFNGL